MGRFSPAGPTITGRTHSLAVASFTFSTLLRDWHETKHDFVLEYLFKSPRLPTVMLAESIITNIFVAAAKMFWPCRTSWFMNSSQNIAANKENMGPSEKECGKTSAAVPHWIISVTWAPPMPECKQLFLSKTLLLSSKVKPGTSKWFKYLLGHWVLIQCCPLQSSEHGHHATIQSAPSTMETRSRRPLSNTHSQAFSPVFVQLSQMLDSWGVVFMLSLSPALGLLWLTGVHWYRSHSKRMNAKRD